MKIKDIYIIEYIAYYKNYNPDEPITEILQNFYFLDYETALNYAKKKNIKDYRVIKLKLGAINKDL